MFDDPENLRKRVDQMINHASNGDDRQKKQRVAAEAFELAQQAEAIERRHQKHIIDSKFQRMVEQLYAAIDRNQRQTHQQLLIQEENMCGLKQERLDRLHRLLYECNDRLSTLQESHRKNWLNGVATQTEKLLLESIREAQRFLQDCLVKELARQDRIF